MTAFELEYKWNGIQEEDFALGVFVMFILALVAFVLLSWLVISSYSNRSLSFFGGRAGAGGTRSSSTASRGGSKSSSSSSSSSSSFSATSSVSGGAGIHTSSRRKHSGYSQHSK